MNQCSGTYLNNNFSIKIDSYFSSAQFLNLFIITLYYELQFIKGASFIMIDKNFYVIC